MDLLKYILAPDIENIKLASEASLYDFFTYQAIKIGDAFFSAIAILVFLGTMAVLLHFSKSIFGYK